MAPLSLWTYIPLLLVLAAATAGGAYLWYRERTRLQAEVNAAEFAQASSDDTESVLEPPNLDGSLLDLLRHWRHRQKAKKLAKQGYVRWYKIGANMSAPKWVKPTAKGAGVAEYYDSSEDVTYLFPKDAMVADSQTGAYVALHRTNEPEPIPIRDPAMPALDGDRLQEVINLEAESDAPGFFDRLDLDPQTLVWATIGLVLLAGAAQQFMG